MISFAQDSSDDPSARWMGRPAAEPRTLFTQEADGSWRPDAHTRGAFRGIHGGALAGLMCATAETALGPDLLVNAITTHLFHPAALEPLFLRTTLVHSGARAAVCDVVALQRDVMVARAAVTSTRATDVPKTPEPAEKPFDPSSLTYIPPYPSPHGQPWLHGISDQASCADGSWWFRMNARITGQESRFARILSSADWTTGVSRQDDWRSPLVRSMPNVELTMHADRHPRSEWVGIYACGRWRRRGNAFASAALVDSSGEYARFSTTILLIP
jgi:hypothetical protein